MPGLPQAALRWKRLRQNQAAAAGEAGAGEGKKIMDMLRELWRGAGIACAVVLGVLLVARVMLAIVAKIVDALLEERDRRTKK